MASYKHGGFFVKNESPEFDKTHRPGQAVPFSGIYRCCGCGREVASNEGQPLPPQNHHQHAANQGPITWRLVVFADHKPKAA